MRKTSMKVSLNIIVKKMAVTLVLMKENVHASSKTDKKMRPHLKHIKFTQIWHMLIVLWSQEGLELTTGALLIVISTEMQVSNGKYLLDNRDVL